GAVQQPGGHPERAAREDEHDQLHAARAEADHPGAGRGVLRQRPRTRRARHQGGRRRRDDRDHRRGARARPGGALPHLRRLADRLHDHPGRRRVQRPVPDQARVHQAPAPALPRGGHPHPVPGADRGDPAGYGHDPAAARAGARPRRHDADQAGLRPRPDGPRHVGHAAWRAVARGAARTPVESWALTRYLDVEQCCRRGAEHPVTDSTIIYTHTDEAPALATYSFLPVVRAYASQAGVAVETRDISLAGRIIAVFPEYLTEEQRIPDALAELGELARTPAANIIKLPNISASIPQLKAAIAELQGQGYALPDYPDDPKTDEERETRARYDKTKRSAVNSVLREGNSDRRAPASVKNYAKSHPHRMGAWSSDSKTNVATMGENDFRSTEKSAVIAEDGALRIELVGDDGTTTVLRESVPVLKDEV